MIEKKLLEAAMPAMKGLTIKDLRVGIGYIALMNSAGNVGLAYTLRNRLGHCCSVFPNAGNLAGMPLEEAASMFLEGNNVIRNGVALAAINSVADVSKGEKLGGDVMENLGIRKGDRVGMIGHFAPIERKIRQITPHLFILEDKEEYHMGDSYKIFKEILWQCDVVIITATSLINKTFTKVASWVKNARTKVLTGPSTPLYPEVFRDEGISILSGMVARDPAKVLEIVGQGGGTFHFKNYSDKISLKVPC